MCWGKVYHSGYVKVRWQSWFSFSTMEVQGIELRLLGLVASAFTHWAISPDPEATFSNKFHLLDSPVSPLFHCVPVARSHLAVPWLYPNSSKGTTSSYDPTNFTVSTCQTCVLPASPSVSTGCQQFQGKALSLHPPSLSGSPPPSLFLRMASLLPL